MNSEFCYLCGAKAVFELASRPKFCPKCGKPFNGSVHTEEAEAEEEEGTERVPKITKSNFAVEVRVDTARPMSLRDVILSGSPNEEQFERPAPNLPNNPQEMLKRSIADCAPTRESKEA